jgi:hypothetical protein
VTELEHHLVGVYRAGYSTGFRDPGWCHINPWSTVGARLENKAWQAGYIEGKSAQLLKDIL